MPMYDRPVVSLNQLIVLQEYKRDHYFHLFKIFINDLSERLNRDDIQKIHLGECTVSHLLFADDLALFNSIQFNSIYFAMSYPY